VLVALAVAWSALPIVLVVLASFKEARDIFEVPPRLLFAPTLANYQALWAERPEFFRALGSSLVVTLGTALVTIVVSTLAGYVLARHRTPAIGEVSERDLLVARSVEHDVLHALGKLGEWAVDVEADVLREALQQLEVELVAPIPAANRTRRE